MRMAQKIAISMRMTHRPRVKTEKKVIKKRVFDYYNMYDTTGPYTVIESNSIKGH